MDKQSEQGSIEDLRSRMCTIEEIECYVRNREHAVSYWKSSLDQSLQKLTGKRKQRDEADTGDITKIAKLDAEEITCSEEFHNCIAQHDLARKNLREFRDVSLQVLVKLISKSV